MKKKISLVIFFLKTVFFSPVNNPAFYCLLLTACLLYFGGNLKKLETVFLFITSAVSIRFISSLKAVSTVFSDSSESLLSRCTNLLPVKKSYFISAYMISAAVYISVLVSFCLFFGINSQVPPDIKSICPTEMITDYNQKSGEISRYVGGIITIPDSLDQPEAVRYRIPINASLVFKYLTSDIIILKDDIPDSVLQSIGTDNRSPEEIFSGNVSNIPQEYVSDFLSDLSPIHSGRLLFISVFVFLFFMNDCINTCLASRNRKNGRILFTGVNLIMYTVFISFCLFVAFDLILPQRKLILITEEIDQYGNIVSGICIMLFTSFVLKTMLFLKDLDRSHD